MSKETYTFLPVAGSIFYLTEDDAVRVIVGDIGVFVNGKETTRPGFLVQEYIELDYGFDASWQTVCPVSDAYFSFSSCLTGLRATSRYLWELIESGKEITIDIEREVLAKFCEIDFTHVEYD